MFKWKGRNNYATVVQATAPLLCSTAVGLKKIDDPNVIMSSSLFLIYM